MTWKQTFSIGLLSTLLGSTACLVYAQIYTQAFGTDFSAIAGPANIIASVMIGCFLMALGYQAIMRWKGDKWLGWMNVIYCTFSYLSIIGVLGFNLPLETESPEMFPGLMIPMHFFPVLSFLTVLPFYKLQKQTT